MSERQLIAEFDRVAESPEGIEKLRDLIFHLAVRGRLSQQREDDGSCEEQLAAVARLRGELEEGEPSVLGQSLVRPYEIPTSWRWATVGDVVLRHLGGGTPSRNNEQLWGGDIPWATVGDIGRSKYVDDAVGRITEAGLAESASNLIPVGSVIVATRVGLGKVSINRVPLAINQDLRGLVLSGYTDASYLYIFFQSHHFVGTGTTVKGIRVPELLGTPLPIPPLAEQRRIVAKVDELIAVCEQLEAAQAERERRRDRLSRALRKRLASAPPADGGFQLVLSQISRLTTRPDSIRSLRSLVLTLGMGGRLGTSRDADPAPSEAIHGARIQLSAFKARGETPTADGNDDKLVRHLPSMTPPKWEVVPLGELFRFIDYRGRTPARVARGTRLITAKNIRMGYLTNDPIEYIEDAVYEKWMSRGFPKPGDILFVTEGATLGFVAQLDLKFKFALAQRTIDLQPMGTVNSEFFLLQLMSDAFQAAVNTNATGTAVRGIKASRLKRIRILFPPLAEQTRIVQRVRELMAICDQLETATGRQESREARLMDALIAKILAQ